VATFPEFSRRKGDLLGSRKGDEDNTCRKRAGSRDKEISLYPLAGKKMAVCRAGKGKGGREWRRK